MTDYATLPGQPLGRAEGNSPGMQASIRRIKGVKTETSQIVVKIGTCLNAEGGPGCCIEKYPNVDVTLFEINFGERFPGMAKALAYLSSDRSLPRTIRSSAVYRTLNVPGSENEWGRRNVSPSLLKVAGIGTEKGQ